MPLGCSIFYPCCVYSHWCTCTPMATLGVVGLFIYSVGLSLVARFDKQGDSQVPQNVERATVQGFTSFLCLQVPYKSSIHSCRSPRL